MSGIEVAGLVLGAFPLAIEALDRYREVAKRCGFWYKIQLEHKKCKDNLTFYKLAYKQQLRLLLLPLVQDGNKVQQLLGDPLGKEWKDPTVAGLLEARLDESYELYKTIITSIDEVMRKLTHELALDNDAIQQNVDTPKGPVKARMKYATTKDGMVYHLYKIKFSNGASVRAELFAELKDLLDKMKSLLSTSDQVTQLIRDKASTAKSSAVNAAICSFWVQANKLFHALTSAWNCCCPQQHSARLLLQHPESTTKKLDFEVMIAKSLASTWEIYQTKIVQGDGLAAFQATTLTNSVPISAIQVPDHRKRQPAKSAMRVPRQVSLSTSLGVLARLQTKAFSSVTLDEILGGQAQPYPTRRQRYTLSLILASSFLQLLETPWLPTTWSKSDIVFISRPEQPNLFALDQPHLRRGLASSEGQVAPSSEVPGKAATVHDFLDLLGILLLELCFGKLLKEQLCRKKLPSGANDIEKRVFDYMAARDWQQEVNEEAGPDFADAVAWCLWGNRSCPPELWRRKMLEEVVQPLEQCRQHLGGGAVAGWAT